MQRTILQVPLPKELRISAERAAEEAGFSSLQEVLRVFMKKFASKKIDLAFEEEITYLSPKAEKRYTKIVHGIENGKEKVYTAKDADDFLAQLHNYGKN